jgi:putative methyltransferase (TIGR04325 family)
VKFLMRDLLPPLLERAIARVRRPQNWFTGPFADWEAAAAAAASGYSDPAILSRVSDATAKVLGGQAAYEQDGVAFNAEPPPSPALAGLLVAAARAGGRLSVVDFGGSLASNFLRWRRSLETLPSVDWLVVEQPTFVAEGRRLFAGRGLPVAFEASLPAGGTPPAAILFGSSLQYVSDPWRVLEDVLARAPDVLVFDRMPVSESDVDSVFVQHVPSRTRPATYPVRAIAGARLHAALTADYCMLARWPCDDAPIRVGRFLATPRGETWIRRKPR